MKDRPRDRETNHDVLHPTDAELEALLRQLPLAKPGRGLDAQISRLLAVEDSTSPRLKPMKLPARSPSRLIWPVIVSAAAVIVLAFGLGWFLSRSKMPETAVHPSTVHSPPVIPVALPQEKTEPVELDFTARLALAAEEEQQLKLLTQPAKPPAPVGVQQTFERVDDEGFVLVQDGAAYQRLQRRAVRRITVVDPQTGEHATVTIPIRETMVRKVEPF